MRIGFVTGEYPPMRGGIGDYTRALGKGLASAGHKIYVLTDRRGIGDQSPDISVENPIRVWDVQSLLKMRQWVTRHQLDIVNVQFETAAYASLLPIHFWTAALRGIKAVSVTTFHDLIPPYIIRHAGPWRKRALWALARQSQGCIVTNSSDFIQLHTAVPKVPVVEIPIGSNISTNTPAGYSREAWRSEHAIASKTFLIGYFGFINPQKGIETLIEAVASVIQTGLSAQLVMIGGGATESDPAQAAYIQQIKAYLAEFNLADRVHWTGFIEESDVSAWFSTCDVITLPFADGVSLRRGSFMAAIAHGCPILTTTPADPIPDLADAVVLIPPGNSAIMADMLRELAADPEKRLALGTQAKHLADRFSWDSIAAWTLDFYRARLAN